MTPELNDLLKLLSLDMEGVAVGEAVAAAPLLALARRHRVVIPAARGWEKLAAAGSTRAVPPALKRAAATERLLALRGAWWLCRLADDLDAAGIAWVALKGPALSQQIYGDPGKRTARDLDILVDPARMAEAVAIAVRLGWQAPSQWEPVMKLTGKIDVQLSPTGEQPWLEIHRALSPAHAALDFGAIGQLSIGAVQAGARSVRALAGEDAVIYVAWHGAKHLWMRLNWLLDLAGLLAKKDWHPDVLIERARDVGAERSLRAGVELCRTLLHLPLEGLPAAAPSVQRDAMRIASWARERISLGPEPEALGGRPWSYRWHFREARVNDRKGRAISRLKSLMAPDELDIRQLGPHRPLALHYAARPFLLGRRIARDLLWKKG